MESTEKKTDELVQRYVDILTNGGFKALFGDIENKDVVMSIINTLLPAHRKVVRIDYMPTEYQGTVTGKYKEYQFDFMCRDISGAVFIVELQKYKEEYWFKRCVSYASRAYDRQNRSGHDYDVPPVYLIGLMGTEIAHPDKEFWKDRYVSEYTFREKQSHDLLDETIVIIFAELAKFCKTEAECVTDTDKMLFVLKNIGRMTDQPQWLQNEIFSRVFEACEIAGFTEEKRIRYEKDMMDEKRLKGQYAAYRKMGREEGREEGEIIGRDNAIRKMSAAGMSPEQICSILEIDVKEIECILETKK